ncbi:MAG: DNA ligase D [Planctomycetes bacterium]|nr:DNA ligase D [Planctomycetota bacterium]
MTLKRYHQKRRFDQTPEPRGCTPRGQGPLRFVVQKHQASRLHYDFRLELDGTLKSWAVPKGPSLNPGDKRLAVMVEDHPLDYRTFEGTIPEGNYGAGAVLVWDEGTYCARATADRRASERRLREGLAQGHLNFVLNGHKLKGEFSLVKIQRGQDNQWLLVKKRDPWASEEDVTEQADSVTSGRSLTEIAAGKRKAARPRALARTPRNKRAVALPDAPKADLLQRVRPMLATLVKEPFDRPGWLFEVKWDGYRAVAEVGPQGVSFYSRNHKSFESRFAPLVESLRRLGREAVLDGEVVVVDDRGQAHFQLLQNFQKTGKGRLLYYVFDLLYLDGSDLRGLPLRRRKELLQGILGALPDVLLSEHVEEHGVAFFEAARAQGLEGILAKDGDSPYREGVRGLEWLKIKTHLRQEAVICGFTEPRGRRRDLGALVLGVYDGDNLVYIGHTGGGLNARGLTDLRSRLEPWAQRACPFRKKPKTNAPVHWVKPQLVCEVSFQEWTQDGLMRQPIFLGLREDKIPQDVRREESRPGEEVATEEKSKSIRSVGRKEPVLTHLDKVYWPKEGYTKGDLIAYYREMAPVLLPYLRDRPQSLHRHPNGMAGKSFFQKDVSRQPPPDWVKTMTIPPGSGTKDVTYVLCQDQASLLYLANLGCIELNPWNSRVDSLENPDYLVIDLDPEDVPFARVVEAARAVHQILDRAGAPSLCKTSGKRGLHVFVPLGARYNYDQARRFAEILARLVHERLPDSTSLVRSPALRQGRVYLDYLQNRRGQTLVAPYAVRPAPGATVSTPLKWAEVKKTLDPTQFNLRTLPKRLDRVGDLWQPILGPGVDLAACLKRLPGG